MKARPKTTNAIAHAVALSQERQTIEDRYLLARSEFVLAAQQLHRFSVVYGRAVAEVPDSIDLTSCSSQHREPLLPELVTATEIGWTTE